MAILQTAGGDALETALKDGSLARVVKLPPSALVLAKGLGSLAEAVAWHNAVGGLLDEVVTYEVYKLRDPAMVNLAELEQVLALEDRGAVARLLALPPAALPALLALQQARQALSPRRMRSLLTISPGWPGRCRRWPWNSAANWWGASSASRRWRRRCVSWATWGNWPKAAIWTPRSPLWPAPAESAGRSAPTRGA